MRTILQKKQRESHTKDMLKTLNLKSVRQQIDKYVLKFFIKIEFNLAPEYLKEKLKKKDSDSRYKLRSADSFAVPQYRKAITQISLFYKGIQFYNDFRTKNQSHSYDVALKNIDDYLKCQ